MQKIVIIDDDGAFLDQFNGMSNKEPAFNVVSVINHPNILSDIAATSDTDIFILNAETNSIEEMLNKVKELYPEAKIVLLFEGLQSYIPLKWFQYEVAGYLLRNNLPSLLNECIATVAKGNWYISIDRDRKIVLRPLNYTQIQSNLSLLSEREREIFELLIQGHPNKIISERLWISPYTVNQHLKTIYKKLKVSSRIELIRMA